MKKFLSLVLAMIMALSLVTISAGATEYKDLTDKDEIQYEEAVAVLNRIGIITGYEDGSFRPETELTRGAAAKIIVSLLIGPDAANALPNASSPYPDVPASHTFAGVISYCKTAGIISGYGDGTFKPANSLTGFAFAKMLLGAIGYKSEVEGFTDTGWTMNVAKIGNAAGLFNRLNFDGSASVNREQACQLALNTLKATMVEYTGGFNVTAGDATVVGAQTRTYVNSNQEYATHISKRRAGGDNTDRGNVNADVHYTVEFGEEHFKDLRMEDELGNYDAFGRPSNEWSYKKVTIGTYPVAPDFVYTTQVAHNVESVSVASKVRALGLNGYDTTSTNEDEGDEGDTALWVNGYKVENNLYKYSDGSSTNDERLASIADLTDEGTVVEVYVSEKDADFITNVVVIKTQLMQIKRVGGDYVSLELYDSGSSDLAAKDSDGSELTAKTGKKATDAYNSEPINKDVIDVEVNDECYEGLKDMKAGDIIAVVPVSTNRGSEEYEVSRFYVPETASGELTRVETYNATSTTAGNDAINVTVGGTEYKIALWNKNLVDIDGDAIKVTRKDVTLYLDEFGNAMLATDVGAVADFMVIGNYRSGLENGVLVTYVNGWNINGEEVSLNVGAAASIGDLKDTYPVGSLVRYASTKTGSTADWKIDCLGVYDVFKDSNTPSEGAAAVPYEIKSSNSRVQLVDHVDSVPGTPKVISEPVVSNWKDKAGYDADTNSILRYIDSSIQFIYVTTDDDNEIDSIEFKKGMQNLTNEEIKGDKAVGFAADIVNAQACLKLSGSDKSTVEPDALVKAVVVKQESNDATVNNLLYVRDFYGSATKTADGVVQGYEVSMMTSEGVKDEIVFGYRNLSKGDFARYTKTATPESASGVKGVTEDNFYTLKGYDQVQKAASVLRSATLAELSATNPYPSGNKYLVRLADPSLRTALVPNISSQYYNGENDKDNNLNIGDETAKYLVNLRGAQWVDLTKNSIDSADDLEDFVKGEAGPAKGKSGFYNKINVALIFNDKISHDNFRSVYLIVITDVKSEPVTTGAYSITVNVNGVKNNDLSTTANANQTKTIDVSGLNLSNATYTINNGSATPVPANGKINVNVSNANVTVDVTGTVQGKILTLMGTQLVTASGSSNTHVKVYANNKLVECDSVEALLVDGVQSATAKYSIPKDAEVVIIATGNPNDGAFVSGGTKKFSVSGTLLSIKDVGSSKDEMSFKMVDDMEITCSAVNTIEVNGESVGSEVVTINLYGNVEATYDGAAIQSGAAVPMGKDLVITNPGDGSVVIGTTVADGTATPDTGTGVVYASVNDTVAFGQGGKITGVSGSLNLYSANRVKLYGGSTTNSTAVDYKVNGTAAAQVNLNIKSGDVFIPTIATDVKVSANGSATFTGFVVNTGNTAATSSADAGASAVVDGGTLEITDKAITHVTGAYKLTLKNGATAGTNSSSGGTNTTGISEGDTYVAASTYVKVAAPTGKAAVDGDATNKKFAAQSGKVTTAALLGADTVIDTMTSVTFDNISGTVEFPYSGEITLSGQVVYGVAKDVEFTVTGSKTTTKAIFVEDSAGTKTEVINANVDGVLILGGADNSSGSNCHGSVKMGTGALTFTEENT